MTFSCMSAPTALQSFAMVRGEGKYHSKRLLALLCACAAIMGTY